jgi:hypothetical protein
VQRGPTPTSADPDVGDIGRFAWQARAGKYKVAACLPKTHAYTHCGRSRSLREHLHRHSRLKDVPVLFGGKAFQHQEGFGSGTTRRREKCFRTVQAIQKRWPHAYQRHTLTPIADDPDPYENIYTVIRGSKFCSEARRFSIKRGSAAGPLGGGRSVSEPCRQ